MRFISFFKCLVNSIVLSAPFLYPLKTWCFQGLEKGCMGTNGVNRRQKTYSFSVFSIQFILAKGICFSNRAWQTLVVKDVKCLDLLTFYRNGKIPPQKFVIKLGYFLENISGAVRLLDQCTWDRVNAFQCLIISPLAY